MSHPEAGARLTRDVDRSFRPSSTAARAAIQPRSPHGGAIVLAAALALAALASGCTRRATQLVAVLETDAQPDVYRCVRVEVNRFPSDPVRGGTLGLRTPEQTTLPFSTGIVPPDGDARARVEVIAELRGDDCAERTSSEAPPRIRRVVRTGFLSEQSLRLPIFLADRCRDVLCASADESCDPLTGLCAPTPVIDPSTLDPAARGEELPFDAGLRDAGPRLDAPLPDAGSSCSTVGVLVGSRGSSVISAFGLAQSADGTRGVRSYVFANGAGGEDLSGSSLGGGFFVVGPRGPTGAALTDDGARGAHVFVHPARGFMVETYTRSGSPSDNSSIGGAGCATARCIAEHLGHFAVLRGTSTLSLVEIATDSSTLGSATIAMGTTEGAVRAGATSLLLAYAQTGMCRLERRSTITAADASIAVPDCVSLDMAELADGSVALAWIDGANGVHVGIADAALTALTPLTVIDASQSAAHPVEVNATQSGFRVTWLDDLAVPLLRSVRFDAAGAPQISECAAADGHTLTEYARFHTVRRGASSAVEWVHGDSEFFGVTWSD